VRKIEGIRSEEEGEPFLYCQKLGGRKKRTRRWQSCERHINRGN
jgi:hypothetical protein